MDRFPVAGVVDVDVGAAEGVVVGVRGGEEGVGDGDDGLAGGGGDGAGGVGGGEVGGVDGHVAGVGEGEGDGDGEGEGAEGEVAGFHVWCWGCGCWVEDWFGGFEVESLEREGLKVQGEWRYMVMYDGGKPKKEQRSRQTDTQTLLTLFLLFCFV